MLLLLWCRVSVHLSHQYMCYSQQSTGTRRARRSQHTFLTFSLSLSLPIRTISIFSNRWTEQNVSCINVSCMRNVYDLCEYTTWLRTCANLPSICLNVIDLSSAHLYFIDQSSAFLAYFQQFSNNKNILKRYSTEYWHSSICITRTHTHAQTAETRGTCTVQYDCVR